MANSVHPYFAQTTIRQGGIVFFCFQLGLNSLTGSCERGSTSRIHQLEGGPPLDFISQIHRPKGGLGSTLESGINIPLHLLSFGIFFRGLQSYYGLKSLKFYYISLLILRIKGLCLSNFQQATFIQKGYVYSGL